MNFLSSDLILLFILSLFARFCNSFAKSHTVFCRIFFHSDSYALNPTERPRPIYAYRENFACRVRNNFFPVTPFLGKIKVRVRKREKERESGRERRDQSNAVNWGGSIWELPTRGAISQHFAPHSYYRHAVLFWCSVLQPKHPTTMPTTKSNDERRAVNGNSLSHTHHERAIFGFISFYFSSGWVFSRILLPANILARSWTMNNMEEVGVSTLRRYLYLAQIHNLALIRHSPVIGKRTPIMHADARAQPILCAQCTQCDV